MLFSVDSNVTDKIFRDLNHTTFISTRGQFDIIRLSESNIRLVDECYTSFILGMGKGAGLSMLILMVDSPSTILNQILLLFFVEVFKELCSVLRFRHS